MEGLEARQALLTDVRVETELGLGVRKGATTDHDERQASYLFRQCQVQLQSLLRVPST